MVTFRLADSLPTSKMLELHSDSSLKSDAMKRRRLEELLDQGYGMCHLADPAIATIVEENLLHFDGERYHLHAWVIMPNHVHVLIETFSGSTLSDIVHGWKSYTGKVVNKLLGRIGTTFWQREYFDRAIRDERHWLAAVDYIHLNPVKAGLVGRAEEWRYSSARRWAERG